MIEYIGAVINSLGSASTSSTTSISLSASPDLTNFSQVTELSDNMEEKSANLDENKDEKESKIENKNSNNDLINDKINEIDIMNKMDKMETKKKFENSLINTDIVEKECTILTERTILKECPICIEEPDLSGLVITTCGHVLCLLCAKTLINKNKKCPICSHTLGIIFLFSFLLF